MAKDNLPVDTTGGTTLGKIFKGMGRAMAPLVARKIKKEDFLAQLKDAWYPVVKKHTNIDEEVAAARERLVKSGFEKVFKTVGVTDEDIRTLLLEIQKEKVDPIRVEKVSRNQPCPCGSGKKYKKCCGA